MYYPGYGGVLYLQDHATAFINGSRFFNNSASSAAGAVNVNSSVLIIHNSVFTNQVWSNLEVSLLRPMEI